MQSAEADRLYQEGVAALKRGDKTTAKEKLLDVIELEETHEQAWLWLSGAVEDEQEKIICLENVLTINPDNEAARKGLEKLGVHFRETRVEPPPPMPAAEPSGSSLLNPISTPEDEAESASEDIFAPSSQESSLRLETAGPRALESEKERQREEHERERVFRESNMGGWYSSTASLVGDEEVITTNLMDLIEAWLWAIIFSNGGVYKKEVEHGNFLHVFVNMIVGAALQAGILIIIVGLSLSIAGIRIDEMVTEIANDPEFALLLEELSDPETGLLATISPLTIALYICGYPIAAAIFEFLGQMMRSFMVDTISHWFSARGDAIQALRSLTIAAVAGNIVLIPIGILLVIAPVAGLIAGIGWGVYRFALDVAAVNAAEDCGIPIAIVTVMLTGVGVGLVTVPVVMLIAYLLVISA